MQIQKEILEKYVFGREIQLVEAYIKDGPAFLRDSLEVSEDEWHAIFDYLVFERNLLYITIVASTEFFLKEYVEHGMVRVREILGVHDGKYDIVFKVVFDYLAISSGGLDYHVMEHRERYVVAIKQRGSDFVRKVLGIYSDKYEENWAKILDFLLHAVCDNIFSEQTYEHGLRAFSRIYNTQREQRKIFESKII